MICSVNEIGTTLTKAAVGSGFPVGLADGIGAAGAWLSARRLDGVDAVLAGVTRGFEPEIDWLVDGPRLHVRDAAIGRCGMSLFELLATGEIERVVVEDADSPLLLIGFGGVVARGTGAGFALSFQTGATVVVTGRTVTSAEQLASADIGGPIEIVAVGGAGDESSAATRSTGGVDVGDLQWAKATELAARTYVPANDASRLSGAGAGLDDND